MKLFLRYVVLAFFLNICAFNTTATTTITSAANGNKIIIQNNNVNCGGLECPKDTYKCAIQSRGTDNNLNIETVKSCLASDGKINSLLKKKKNYLQPVKKILQALL